MDDLHTHPAAPTPGPLAKAHADESGATTLEWALLLAAIGLPMYWIVSIGLAALVGHYQMVVTLLGLPTP